MRVAGRIRRTLSGRLFIISIASFLDFNAPKREQLEKSIKKLEEILE